MMATLFPSTSLTFTPSNFPPNKLGLTNGSVIVAAMNMQWFNIKKGDKFTIKFDGKYIVASNKLEWTLQGLIDEIEAGIWTLD